VRVQHPGAERPVLAGVDLELVPGAAVAVMGPSGSGKTTLLSVAGLLLRATSGEVRLDGTAVDAAGRASDHHRRRRFAWVFQSANALGRRSVLDNAALYPLALGASRRDARDAAGAALAAVGLAAAGTRPAATLSGGELQRLAIARALAHQPSYLFADEPTGNLDRRSADHVAEVLATARPPSTALLLATHDPAVAARCDVVLTLRDGCLVPA
jgi:ABC-type lipoprotein export system ATPase subunit